MNNCLFFALSLWFTKGGYIIIRRSRHSWIPHFMWTNNLDGIYIIEFIPSAEYVSILKRSRIARWLPIGAFLFRGKVRHKVGDPIDK